MIIVDNRELLIPNDEQYIGTTQDTHSDNRVFRIARYSQSGEDLSGLTYRLDLLYPKKRQVYTISASTNRTDRAVIVLTALYSKVYSAAGTHYFTFHSGHWLVDDTTSDVNLSEIGVIISFTPRNDDEITVVSTIRNVSSDTVSLSKIVDDEYIMLTWHITEAQLAIPGTVLVSLRGSNTSAEVRWASFQGVFYVEQNNYTPAMFTGPLSELEYFEQVLAANLKKIEYLPTKYSELENAIQDSEAWAKGTRGGSPVSSSDDTYHNNSKYYSDLAKTSKNAAAASEAAAGESASEAARTVSDLNAQFQNAIRALTVDSEVQGIRVGADGVIYTTAGEAVRTQFEDLKAFIYNNLFGMYDADTTYMLGDIVQRNGSALICKVSESTVGRFVASEWENARLEDIKRRIGDNFATIYSETNSYSVGDWTIAADKLYQCITPIDGGEAWTPSHWRQITVADSVAELKSQINNLNNGKFVLTVSDMIQGSYNSSGAVLANTARIRNEGFIPVSKGQVLKFKPGTVTTQLIYGSFGTKKEWLGQTPFITTETEIRLPHDGYIIAAFANATKTEIVPSDFDAEFAIVEKWAAADADIREELGNDINDCLPVLSKEPTGKTVEIEKRLSFDYYGILSNTNGFFEPWETGYRTTDYIPLKNVTGIYRTGTTTMFSLWTYSFYDSDKQLLGFKASTTDYTIETYNGKQVTWLDIDDYPNAKYIRISMQPSSPYTYYAVSEHPGYVYDVPQITINGIDPMSSAKFFGKKIVNFGDSIFGNFRDTNDTTDKSISKMIAEATGATVYNCGFGGCRMSWHSNYWRAFSMFALADAITTGVWTDQDAAIADAPSGMPAYFAETLALLKTIDFSTVDYITIGYGVNDFTGDIFIDERSGLTEVQYFKGALEYSIRTILAAYPNIRIIDITPCWKWFPNSETGLLDYDSDDAQAVNSRNLTLPDYVEACKTVCEKYHIPCIDTYTELGFNPYSYKAYFNVKGVDGAVASDGTHPKQAGRQLRADRIVGQLNALY